MGISRVYSKNEEIFNSISHGLGSLFGIVGTSIMLTVSAIFYQARAVAASAVYGATLIVMFTMSTLYHAIPFPKVKKVMQILDHDCIYLLIAGTYTPITLVLLKDLPSGMLIFTVVWACAILGVILNAANMERFKHVSIVLYLVMGWMVVFDFRAVCDKLGTGGSALLLSGGICYTVGVIFYKLKRVRFMHGVWHLFVVAGSVLHYLCILLFVLPHNR